MYSPLHKCCVVNLIVVSLLVCTKMTVIMEYTSGSSGVLLHTVRFTDTALVKFMNLRGSVNNVELIRSCNTTLTPY